MKTSASSSRRQTHIETLLLFINSAMNEGIDVVSRDKDNTIIENGRIKTGTQLSGPAKSAVLMQNAITKCT